eukprot:COSAG01_NODE_3_length_63519_cov_1591.007663_34_plen_271_part_00
MTNKLKFLISIFISLSLILTSSVYGTWEESGNNWNHADVTQADNPIIRAGIAVNPEMFIEAISQMSLITAQNKDINEGGGVDNQANVGSASPSFGFIDSTTGTENDHVFAILSIDNNNPLGFQIEIESQNACKFRRQVWDGTTWSVDAINSGQNYNLGNTLDYTMGMRTWKDNVYGIYADGTTNQAYPSELNTYDIDVNTTSRFTLDNFTINNGDATGATIQFLDSDTNLNVQHGTNDFRLSFVMFFTPTTELLRGKYDETITFTLIDGE